MPQIKQIACQHNQGCDSNQSAEDIQGLGNGWWLGAGCPNDSSVTRERGMRGVEV